MKNITCSIIDSPPKRWGFWRDVRKRKTYLNFNKSSFPDNAYFCDNVLDNIKNFEKIQIIERIGSPSADAEVYRIKFNNVEFAMKLIPRKDIDSEERNKMEIQTALRASEYSDYFPITFAYGFCENSGYFISLDNYFSSFIPEAQKFNIVYKMEKQIIDKRLKKRFLADVRNEMSIEDLKNKYNLKTEGNDIQVDYLISELANGDLGNWMKVERNIKDWRKILIEIIYGIYYLTTQIRKVHPDLHPGNVLIVKDENDKDKALIHDFGRCFDINDDIPATYKSTLLSFCNEFLSCKNRDDLNIPRDIVGSIQDLQSFVEKEDININNIKNIYKSFVIPIVSGTEDIYFE